MTIPKDDKAASTHLSYLPETLRPPEASSIVDTVRPASSFSIKRVAIAVLLGAVALVGVLYAIKAASPPTMHGY
ncbi:MAG: hypothetical protein AB7K09_09775 [Planctomycetota bacterium]